MTLDMATRPLTFLELPVEVRSIIYAAIFAREGRNISIQESNQGIVHAAGGSPSVTALRSTCRAIYGETRDWLNYDQMIFSTEYKNQGVEVNRSLPRLGFALSDSRFVAVKTLVVGVTDLWRVLNSIDSLTSNLPQLESIKTLAVKRMPYSYWKDKFPTIMSFLSPADRYHDARTCQPLLKGHGIPELEIARFRLHIRSHPLINEDEKYMDEDEDGFTPDRGDEFYERNIQLVSAFDLELHVCSRWLLLDRNATAQVQLAAVSLAASSGRHAFIVRV